jgi:serine O-acetyltransferase
MSNTRERLARSLHKPWGSVAFKLLTLLGVEIPRSVKIGRAIELPHGAFGLVVHQSTIIGDRVKLFQGVTIGRADQYLRDVPKGGHAVIEDDVVLGAGSKILFRGGEKLVIGAGSVIGANAVVTTDVPAGQVWAGVPARYVRDAA